MDLFEKTTNSFIIKIWLEEADQQHVTWRGRITHVTSGKQRYLQNLDEIPLFLVPYLERVGVKFGLCWQVKRWLRQWWLTNHPHP